MSFDSDLGQFFRWFQLLGQTAFSSSTKSASKYIPVGIRLGLAVLASIVLCLYWKQFGEFALLSNFSQIANVQLAILLALDFITALIVAVQAWLLPSLYVKLYAQIYAIEELSRKKFSWNLKSLRKSIKRKMLYMFVAFLLPYIATFFTKQITSACVIIAMCDCMLALFALTTHFHVLFYIQLFNHMLQSFVNYLEWRANVLPTSNVTTINSGDHNSTNTMEKLELHYFKLLHFNLWEIVQTINQLFGWILFIYFLDHFLYTVYIFFQTAIILQNPSNLIEIIRE